MPDNSVVFIKSPVGIIKASFQEDILIELSITNKLENVTKSEIGKKFEKQIGEYFEGKRKSFDIKFNFKGTEFQNQVWNILTQIPFGETITYKEIANRIKRPKSFRAVGNAVGDNPIAIIVPCHRVLASNGLGGYAYGLPMKKELLKLENVKM